MTIYEKHLMTERNNILLKELHSTFSADDLSKLYKEGKNVEIDADFDELTYHIKCISQ